MYTYAITTHYIIRCVASFVNILKGAKIPRVNDMKAKTIMPSF